MNVSDYKIKLQQNSGSINKHLPEIPKYQQVTRQLWDALQGDTVWSIMKYLGVDKMDDQQFRAELEGHSFRVSEKVTPHLYKLFYGVKEKLHFDHPVDFYVVSDSTLNACAFLYQPQDPDSPYVVQVNSAMIDTMDDVELCSVVGHELGHLLDENLVLAKIIGFLFPQRDQYGFPIMPVPLRYKYFFWKQLGELFADRYGYLATEDINACISSEFKLKSGLKLDKMDADISAFIEENRLSLQHFISGQGLSLNNASHPVSPIRIEALNLFANAKTEKELSEGMDVLVDAIARLNQNNEMGLNLLWFVASAGLIMASADGEITNDEVETILNNMSEFYMFPLDVLKQVTPENCSDVFNKSLQALIQINPDGRPQLFLYLVNIMATDFKFKQSEIELLMQMGKEAFGFEEEFVVRLLADGIRMSVASGVVPSTGSIS